MINATNFRIPSRKILFRLLIVTICCFLIANIELFHNYINNIKFYNKINKYTVYYINNCNYLPIKWKKFNKNGNVYFEIFEDSTGYFIFNSKNEYFILLPYNKSSEESYDIWPADYGYMTELEYNGFKFFQDLLISKKIGHYKSIKYSASVSGYLSESYSSCDSRHIKARFVIYKNIEDVNVK